MADTNVVVDTDVFIMYLRLKSPVKRERSVLHKLTSAFKCYTTVINAYELFAGVRNERHVEAVKSVLAMVDMLSLRKEDVESIGLLSANLRASGQDIGEMDCLIAGICLANGMPIVTGNIDHFIRVPDLLVISLPVVEANDNAEAIIEAAQRENDTLRQS